MSMVYSCHESEENDKDGPDKRISCSQKLELHRHQSVQSAFRASLMNDGKLELPLLQHIAEDLQSRRIIANCLQLCKNLLEKAWKSS